MYSAGLGQKGNGKKETEKMETQLERCLYDDVSITMFVCILSACAANG